MTIIVTGGAGFIGGNFIHYHLKEHPEDRVVCVDKLTYAGNLSTLKPVMDNPNFRFCKLDICDRDGIFALFEEEKPDAVINFAAESHVDRSIEDPGIFLQTNIIGTATMMDACRAFGNIRYHQVSTDEVYGDLPLELQKDFLQALDAGRKLGITANDSFLLLPCKSVTAVIGLANRPQGAKIRGCGYCAMREECAYRRDGKFCGD